MQHDIVRPHIRSPQQYQRPRRLHRACQLYASAL